MVIAYTTLLTMLTKYASEWKYCELNMLHMTMVYICSWHANGHDLFSLSYMTMLVINTTHICRCLMLYVDGRTPVLCTLLLLQSSSLTTLCKSLLSLIKYLSESISLSWTNFNIVAQKGSLCCLLISSSVLRYSWISVSLLLSFVITVSFVASTLDTFTDNPG